MNIQNLKFKNEKEEVEFHREYNSKSSYELKDEINTLLGFNGEETISFHSISNTDLILLRNAIKKKIKNG